MDFMEKVFEYISNEMEDNGRDDVLKLTGIDLDESTIMLDVESLRHEIDFFTKIFLTEDRKINITGLESYVVEIEPNFDDVEETACRILHEISMAVEFYEDNIE